MKVKGKRDYQVTLPKIFKEKVVGTTNADKPDKVIGRKLSLYGRDIDEKMRKYYYKFHFKISDVSGDKALCELMGHEVSKSFIAKNVKSFSTRIDGRVKEKTTDGKTIILKPFIVTAKNVQTSIAKSIRKKMESFLTLYVSGNELDSIIERVLSDEIQRDAKKILNTIYPISTVEIRKIEIN